MYITYKIGLIDYFIFEEVFLHSSAVHAECTAEEYNLIASYYQSGVQALAAGNIKLYNRLNKALEKRLFNSCLSTLGVKHKAKTGCTNNDENLISSYSTSAIQALMSGNVSRIMRLKKTLESQLSKSCLNTLRESQQAKSMCPDNEKKLILSSYQSGMRSIANNDFSRYIQIMQDLEKSLSKACLNALARAQQAQAYRGRLSYGANRGYRAPSVYDHGGGTFSVPGVGACGPGGCMAFD